MSAIQIEKLSKKYSNGRGVENVSLTVEQGEVLGLLGSNGSGKTTIMKMMAGFIHPAAGTISILGKDVAANTAEALTNVGFLIENPSYYPYLTGKQNLILISRLYKNCTEGYVMGILEKLGLDKVCNEKVKNYSLGMKQRLGLAMALVAKPAVLVLDEPFNGLDIEGMQEIRTILQEQANQKKSILLSSHLTAELEQVCTHIAIISNGCIIAKESKLEIILTYGTLENYYLTSIKQERLMQHG